MVGDEDGGSAEADRDRGDARAVIDDARKTALERIPPAYAWALRLRAAGTAWFWQLGDAAHPAIPDADGLGFGNGPRPRGRTRGLRVGKAAGCGSRTWRHSCIDS